LDLATLEADGLLNARAMQDTVKNRVYALDAVERGHVLLRYRKAIQTAQLGHPIGEGWALYA
jgi:hypothetical protein